jgi:hypothetical protein
MKGTPKNCSSWRGFEDNFFFFLSITGRVILHNHGDFESSTQAQVDEIVIAYLCLPALRIIKACWRS